YGSLSYYTVTKSGYTFVGWSENKDATAEWTSGAKQPTANTTWYAVWNGTVTEATEQIQNDGESSIVVTMMANGSTFKTETLTYSQQTRYNNQYASQNHSYDLSVHAGSATRANETLWYSTDGTNYSETKPTLTLTYSNYAPTKTGYTFSGWDTTGNDVADWTSGTKTFSTSTTITACWKIKTYTVIWLNADGTTLKSETLDYGTMPSYTGSTPTKAGDGNGEYEFTGWSPEIVVVTEDATYTAQFTYYEYLTVNVSSTGAITTSDSSWSGTNSFGVNIKVDGVVSETISGNGSKKVLNKGTVSYELFANVLTGTVSGQSVYQLLDIADENGDSVLGYTFVDSANALSYKMPTSSNNSNLELTFNYTQGYGLTVSIEDKTTSGSIGQNNISVIQNENIVESTDGYIVKESSSAQIKLDMTELTGYFFPGFLMTLNDGTETSAEITPISNDNITREDDVVEDGRTYYVYTITNVSELKPVFAEIVTVTLGDKPAGLEYLTFTQSEGGFTVACDLNSDSVKLYCGTWKIDTNLEDASALAGYMILNESAVEIFQGEDGNYYITIA
ncbi:MAG: InlB B-repeat-containing protein, partial [Candidatus Onthoplasma sp.]